MLQALESAFVVEEAGLTGHLPHQTLVRLIRLLAHTPDPDVARAIRPFVTIADAELRAEAIRALGHLRDLESLVPLSDILRRDADPRVRAVAAAALGAFACETVIDPLVGALKDRQALVRRAAARALATLGPLATASLQQAVKQHRWALSLGRQRLAWAARRLLRRRFHHRSASHNLFTISRVPR